MISNGIVKSARFLKMPPTTQNLYFHLIMNADDDGVVEAFPIMRMVGATEDDLKILMDKVFVYLLNDDLVAYVNNWTEHNKVRLERKIDSLYKDLLLKVVPDVDYRENKKKLPKTSGKKVSDKCQTNDGRLSAEDRLVEDRLVEDRLVSFKEIQSFYENNGFGTLSAKTGEDFIYWIDDFRKIGCTEEDAIKLIIHAMEKSIDNNVRKYAYINSILIDWEQKKVLNVEQVKALDKQRKASNKANERVWIESGDDF